MAGPPLGCRERRRLMSTLGGRPIGASLLQLAAHARRQPALALRMLGARAKAPNRSSAEPQLHPVVGCVRRPGCPIQLLVAERQARGDGRRVAGIVNPAIHSHEG